MPRSTASEQRRFALRFIAFGLPLFALYTFPYEENGMSEAWFTRYLSGYARVAGGALSLIEPGIHVSGQDILGRYGLRIIKSCDAMEAVILFMAAVLAFPAAWRTRLIGVALGTLAIVTVNVIRICSLYYVGVYRQAQFEFYHLEVWPLILVASAGLAFVAWSRWATQTQQYS
jgi:exosortase H (IPTLxxWG-CTERM-specific)